MTSPIVVMGVAGCGKSTIGRLLAGRLGVPYAEADSLHPPANRDKMRQGHPLTDEDRRPWLAAVAARLRADGDLVASCSALKRGYRDILREASPDCFFLHLLIDRETAIRRVSARSGHFMPASLVDSQFADLEPLRDEAGLAIDATLPLDQVMSAALAAIGRYQRGRALS